MTMNSFASIQDGVAGESGAEGRSPAPAMGAGGPAAPRRARSRPITLLVASAAALIAAVATGAAVMIHNLRDMALIDSQRELKNIALVLAAQTDRIFEAAERVQIDLIDRVEARRIASSEDFERYFSGHDVHLMLKDKIVGLPHVGTFTLFNADGKLFNFSRAWPIPPIDVSDRDFFVAFRSDPRLSSYVSEPIRNRATGTWVVQVARKVAAPNGELIGLVTAAIELQSIEQFFASISLGPDSSISLLHRNGELLARYPHVDAMVGRSFPNGMVGALAPDADSAVDRRVSIIGRPDDRIVAVCRVAHYPLVVGASTTVTAALAGWKKQAMFLAGAAGLIALTIAVLVLVVVRQLLRGERQFQHDIDEQKLHLRAAIDNMSQGFLMFDSSKRLVICNRQYIAVYGLSPDIVKPGCTFRELMCHSKERGTLQGDVEQACADLDARLALNKTTRRVVESGDGRSFHVVSHPVAGGGWVVTHEDITERRQAEKERDQNREFLDLILENVPAPIFVKEAGNRRYVLVNRAGETFWGISRAEMIGKTSAEVFPKEEADLIALRDDQLLQSDRPSFDERQIQTPCNGVRSIVARRHTVRGDDGQPKYLIGLIEDVTERKQADDRNRRTQKFLDTVIENVPATIVVKDARDFTYLMINRAGETLLGIPRDKIVGRTDVEIFASEQADITRARDIRTVQSGEPLEIGEEQYRTPGNGVRVVTSKRVALSGGDGAPLYLVAVIGDITERAHADARIAYMAHHDALTGLANRALFSERIEDACARQRRRGETFAVFMLDLDGFKDVNDSFGHSAGDALLKEMSLRLKSSVRETDVLARLGGDEFAIIQAGEEDQRAGALALASRILEVIGQPVELAGSKVNVGTSIGIALAPEDGVEPEELLKKADLALYRTKSEGRNGFNFFRPEMTVEADARYRLRNEIRDAIAGEEFELHYQPVFDVKSREACGVEALIRWRHPVKGLLSPDTFIPLAEESGLIVALGEWILERACKDAASWPSHIKVAVNLSAVQFRKGGLFEVILYALVDSGLAPERLELEITESVLLENEADYRAMLQQLKQIGVSIVLDDFGQGYSSLGYLTRFPVDKIKIDKAFTQGLSKRVECTAVIASVLTLARGLDIVTTAEGVETEEQLDLLRAAGVDFVQGYLLGRPVPASRLDFSRAAPNRRQVA
jgi:diguanylate cyclase (GGDEF)-like protein/PAS domain S-box-containing protein